MSTVMQFLTKSNKNVESVIINNSSSNDSYQNVVEIEENEQPNNLEISETAFSICDNSVDETSILKDSNFTKRKRNKMRTKSKKSKTKKATGLVVENSRQKVSKQTNTNLEETKSRTKHKQKNSKKVETESKANTTPPSTKKINAFEFMMESRHKVIGRNSPGKDVVNEDTVLEPLIETNKRKKRKAFINELLEDWAEQKGASKRRKEYDEETVCIKEKLEIRAQNMKKMLNIETENEEIISRPKKKRINVISSDTESQDSINTNSNLKSVENDSIIKSGRKKRNNKNKTNGEVDKQWKIKIKLDVNNEDSNKRVLRKRQPKKMEDYVTSSDDDSSCESKPTKTGKKPLKIAPVFAKSLPKPKLDPETIEAKRQFLLSGLPSSLKKELIKQQSLPEVEFDVFPTISHVQHKNSNNEFWNLPKIELNLINNKPLKLKSIQTMCKSLTNIQIHEALRNEIEPKPKIKNYSKFVKEIKNNNPNYPVYKVFKQIYEKTENVQNESKFDRKSSSDDVLVKENAMWTEKYKPKSSNDILEFGANRKVQKEDLDSESEFDSNDSSNIIKSPQNTIILTGALSCGKSTAIYAICNELGFNVLELNASSKRTGKKLLQDLQEATQSHQVHKSDSSLSSFFKKTQGKIQETPGTKTKMCVLLVEDVDLVFEQDEGFINALSQLMLTSKRPIILTTTDVSSLLIQKFLFQNQIIRFKRLSSKILSVWLQIVCLIEGIYVHQQTLSELLDYNKGDVRKSLLELQFWTKSGGQYDNNRMIKRLNEFHSISEYCDDLGDDNSNLPTYLTDNDKVNDDYLVHYNCIKGFEIFRQFDLPDRLNLDLIWWNFSNLFSISDNSSQRIKKFLPQINYSIINNQQRKVYDDKKKDRKKLNVISKFYDNLILVDCMFKKWNSNKLKDSLELEECKDNYYNDNLEFSNDLGHLLISGSLKEFNKVEDNFSTINMALPNEVEERWHSKVSLCNDTLGSALGLSSHLGRTSVSVDYQPFLRNIARSELKRSLNNTKRNNRFYNYLSNLNINCRDNVYKLACNILTDDSYN